MKRKHMYLENKSRLVGEVCRCPICGGKFVKKTYNNAFCSNECKNKFHNDRKRGNRNDYYRIYNEAHKERLGRIGLRKLTEYEMSQYSHPFSEESVQG